MNEEQIEKVKQVLTECNPLGDFAIKVPDLNNYNTEAIDLLFYIDQKSSVKKIDKIMVKILEEAFGFPLHLKDSLLYATRIKQTFEGL
jgi:hypothetical protein